MSMPDFSRIASRMVTRGHGGVRSIVVPAELDLEPPTALAAAPIISSTIVMMCV
jgi:hypothetical protein